jgi:hypothetical protein
MGLHLRHCRQPLFASVQLGVNRLVIIKDSRQAKRGIDKKKDSSDVGCLCISKGGVSWAGQAEPPASTGGNQAIGGKCGGKAISVILGAAKDLERARFFASLRMTWGWGLPYRGAYLFSPLAAKSRS